MNEKSFVELYGIYNDTKVKQKDRVLPEKNVGNCLKKLH